MELSIRVGGFYFPFPHSCIYTPSCCTLTIVSRFAELLFIFIQKPRFDACLCCVSAGQLQRKELYVQFACHELFGGEFQAASIRLGNLHISSREFNSYSIAIQYTILVHGLISPEYGDERDLLYYAVWVDLHSEQCLTIPVKYMIQVVLYVHQQGIATLQFIRNT